MQASKLEICLIGVLVDINECLLGIAKCNQRCRNLPGSYSCGCKKGYLLAPDNITCKGKL